MSAVFILCAVEFRKVRICSVQSRRILDGEFQFGQMNIANEEADSIEFCGVLPFQFPIISVERVCRDLQPLVSESMRARQTATDAQRNMHVSKSPLNPKPLNPKP